jgi:hypothetical protein
VLPEPAPPPLPKTEDSKTKKNWTLRLTSGDLLIVLVVFFVCLGGAALGAAAVSAPHTFALAIPLWFALDRSHTAPVH